MCWEFRIYNYKYKWQKQNEPFSAAPMVILTIMASRTDIVLSYYNYENHNIHSEVGCSSQQISQK